MASPGGFICSDHSRASNDGGTPRFLVAGCRSGRARHWITLPMQSLPMTLFLFSLLMVARRRFSYLPAFFWASPNRDPEAKPAAAAARGSHERGYIANIAGFFGPTLVGYLHTRTGSLSSGYAMRMASGIASAILLLLIPGTRCPAPAEVSTSPLPVEV